MGSAKHPTLGRLVGDADAFSDASWGALPFLFRSSEKFSELLSSDAISDLLERSTRRPHFRMVRDGTTLGAHEVSTTVRIAGVPTADVADTDRIAAELAAGATLVMQSLERIHPPLREFCHELQSEIGHPVQANAYLSPPASSALARHADTHDVFVVQLEGSKRWDVEGLGELTLDVSDVLYIPRGCAHAAATNSQHSLHLTIGVTAVTVADVVRRAAAQLDGLDRPLPLAFHTDGQLGAVADTIAVAMENAAGQLAVRDPVDIARAEQRRARKRSERPARLRVELALLRMTDATVLRHHPDATVHIDGDDSVTLRYAERELRMPAAAAEALASLVAADAVCVGDLTGLNAASRLVLARRLVREGAAEQC